MYVQLFLFNIFIKRLNKISKTVDFIHVVGHYQKFLYAHRFRENAVFMVGLV